MELWIRSQNKGGLIKAEIIGQNDGVIKAYNNNNIVELGEYKSEERALEVLGEIQNILKPQMILSRPGKPIAETCDGLVYTTPNEYEIKELSTYVYEMPEK